MRSLKATAWTIVPWAPQLKQWYPKTPVSNRRMLKEGVLSAWNGQRCLPSFGRNPSVSHNRVRSDFNSERVGMLLSFCANRRNLETGVIEGFSLSTTYNSCG